MKQEKTAEEKNIEIKQEGAKRLPFVVEGDEAWADYPDLSVVQVMGPVKD